MIHNDVVGLAPNSCLSFRGLSSNRQDESIVHKSKWDLKTRSLEAFFLCQMEELVDLNGVIDGDRLSLLHSTATYQIDPTIRCLLSTKLVRHVRGTIELLLVELVLIQIHQVDVHRFWLEPENVVCA